MTLPCLLILGCLGARDHALFSDSSSDADGLGTAGSSSSGEQPGTGASPNADGASSSGGSGAATGATGTGGQVGEGAAPSTSGAGGTGGGQPDQPPNLTSCSQVPGGIVSPESGHCYLVELANRTFAEARDACLAKGGHLVTVSSESENELLGELHDGAHWLGATDGRDARAAGAGAYFWVTDEPWVYADWADDQPNAVATDCLGESGGAHCYEHCAYQTGDDAWIDRACWHSIASICEWDLEPELGAGGAPGAGGVAAAGAPSDPGAGGEGGGSSAAE